MIKKVILLIILICSFNVYAVSIDELKTHLMEDIVLDNEVITLNSKQKEEFDDYFDSHILSSNQINYLYKAYDNLVAILKEEGNTHYKSFSKEHKKQIKEMIFDTLNILNIKGTIKEDSLILYLDNGREIHFEKVIKETGYGHNLTNKLELVSLIILLIGSFIYVKKSI